MSEAAGAARAVRPPNAGETAIRSCLARMQKIGEPNEVVDAKWVDNYNLGGAEAHEIVGLLKWLGIIDSQGRSTGLWNDLRADQRPSLANLVRKSYAPIFNAVDVEAADRKMVEGAFISAYKTGNPGRLVTAFLTLCSIAGIVTLGVEPPAAPGPDAVEEAGRTGSPGEPARAPPHATPARATPHPGRVAPAPAPAAAVTFNVEIPADWDADRVRRRVAEVLDAVRAAGG